MPCGRDGRTCWLQRGRCSPRWAGVASYYFRVWGRYIHAYYIRITPRRRRQMTACVRTRRCGDVVVAGGGGGGGGGDGGGGSRDLGAKKALTRGCSSSSRALALASCCARVRQSSPSRSHGCSRSPARPLWAPLPLRLQTRLPHSESTLNFSLKTGLANPTAASHKCMSSRDSAQHGCSL